MEQSPESFKIDHIVHDDFGIIEAESPEQRLWRAVLMQTVVDATGKTTADRNPQAIKSAAQQWLHYGGRDFRIICEFAGLEPTVTYKMILDYITNPTMDHRSSKEKRKDSSLSLAA